MALFTDSFPSKLGGGIPGAQPRGGLTGYLMEGGGARGTDRDLLRRMAGFTVFPNNANAITPFRRFFNAGDAAGALVGQQGISPLLGRPINQVGSSSLVSRLHTNTYGGVQPGQSFFSGNPKYVYDSSLYVRYRGLVAKNRLYNDSSFGGDQSNASEAAIRRVRRGG